MYNITIGFHVLNRNGDYPRKNRHSRFQIHNYHNSYHIIDNTIYRRLRRLRLNVTISNIYHLFINDL